jgi:hypothetical protein
VGGFGKLAENHHFGQTQPAKSEIHNLPRALVPVFLLKVKKLQETDFGPFGMAVAITVC